MTLPSPLAEEDVIQLWYEGWKIFSPRGQIGTVKCVRDDDAAIKACRNNGVTILALPQFRLQAAPPLILVSRKPPWPRSLNDYIREGDHPGIYTEFYRNERGRYMRLNDAYRHAVYQLQRAEFPHLPPGFPDPWPDFDLAWHPKEI